MSDPIRRAGRRLAWAAAFALLMLPSPRSGLHAAEERPIVAPAPRPAPGSLKARIVRYRKQLAEYNKARGAYEKVAGPYWKTVTAKRTARRKKRAARQAIGLDDYVLTQPVLYTGPREPDDPQKKPGAKRKVPIVEDFLREAQANFGFVPKRPDSEMQFKKAYARAALAAGLTKEACVRIYGFEATGNGRHHVQAGLEYGKPKERAISTALGYNQLLTTNTVGLVAQIGDELIAGLRAKAAAASGERRAELEAKTAALGKMIRFARSVKDDWYEHGKLADTPKGIGMHALNLDIDIGPHLQVQKLLNSVVFARRNGYSAPLTAAELEMMNLTGDGNGIDMVLMSRAMREKVPTSNFFQQGGYERNPVASRNNTVAKLIAATDDIMDKETQLEGARELAAAFDAVARGGQ